MAPVEVRTERLTLMALSPDPLHSLVRGWTELEAALGVQAADIRVPEEFREVMPQSFAVCLDQCTANPGEYLWYTVWLIIHAAENRVLGTTGFAGRPNERGEVFTGYWIDERYRNQGYVSEAVRALTKWAFENPAVRAITSNTPEENIASQRVLEKSGFKRCGEFEGQPLWRLERSQEDPDRHCRPI